MMTNKIAWVVIPNKMIANGNQAIDGSVCSPVISDPTAARNGLMRDTTAPTTAPISTARANPMSGALGRGGDRVPQQAGPQLVPQVRQRRARAGEDGLLPAAEVDQLPDASTIAMASRTGHRPPQARVARRRPP